MHAGNIYAAVGLRDTRTGDTLCDEKHADRPRADGLPGAGHLDRDRAEDEGRPRQARRRAAEARLRGPVVPHVHRTRRRARRSSPAWASSTSRSSSTACKREFKVECERRQARGRLPRDDHARRSTPRASTSSSPAVAASTATCCIEIEPGERGAGFVFENDIVGGVIPKEFIPAIEKGIREAMSRGVLAGYPVDRRARSRSTTAATTTSTRRARPSRSPARSRSRTAPSSAGLHLLEPMMSVEVVVPRGLHGRRHRRPELAPRQDPRHEPARQRAGHRRRGAARDDVRLRDRPAQQDAGPRDVHACSSRTTQPVPSRDPGRDRREGQAAAKPALRIADDRTSRERRSWPRKNSSGPSPT